jgi:hypothetical protein
MKPARPLLATAWMAGALAIAAAAPVFAQVPPGCAALCAVTCVKPISIPDRWDDVTAIPGYTGAVSRQPNWRNNGRLDLEAFSDVNANGFWDPGEPFTDGNANGVWDHEAYHPLNTGYIAAPNPANVLAPAGDLGLELTLHTGSPGDAPSPGQYFSIDFPALNRGTPMGGNESYLENFADCTASPIGPGDNCQTEPGILTGPTNQLMRGLMAQDPNAYWDPITGQVAGSEFPPGMSPRIIRFPAHDPRHPIADASHSVQVTKVLAFFMEEMTGPAEVRGRLMQATGLGTTCGGGSGNAGFVVSCATPATPTTWGSLKSQYR